jgi:hypothetical protein
MGMGVENSGSGGDWSGDDYDYDVTSGFEGIDNWMDGRHASWYIDRLPIRHDEKE